LPTANTGKDPVFTDDLAPIEWLTNKIVVDYFLAGGLEELQ
jgi:hypothetical protein